MGVIGHPSRTAVPPAAVTRILSRFSREELEGFVAVAIDLMDLADGDADMEDATDLEDDHTISPHAIGASGRGPGCPISDQDAGAYIEWTAMRGSQKRGPNLLAGHEDDEDGGDDEAIDEREPEERAVPVYGVDQTKWIQGQTVGNSADSPVI